MTPIPSHHVQQSKDPGGYPTTLDTPPFLYATLHKRTHVHFCPELVGWNQNRAQRAEAGQKGFHERALPPKARPLSAQLWTGLEGPKGQAFSKTFRKLRKQRHPVPRYGVGHDSHPTGAEAHPEPSRREPDPLTAYCQVPQPSPRRCSLHPLRLLPQFLLLVE